VVRATLRSDPPGPTASSASVLWFPALGLGARALAKPLNRPGTWRAVDIGVGVVMLLGLTPQKTVPLQPRPGPGAGACVSMSAGCAEDPTALEAPVPAGQAAPSGSGAEAVPDFEALLARVDHLVTPQKTVPLQPRPGPGAGACVSMSAGCAEDPTAQARWGRGRWPSR
jgi:hypothetical protein